MNPRNLLCFFQFRDLKKKKKHPFSLWLFDSTYKRYGSHLPNISFSVVEAKHSQAFALHLFFHGIDGSLRSRFMRRFWIATQVVLQKQKLQQNSTKTYKNHMNKKTTLLLSISSSAASNTKKWTVYLLPVWYGTSYWAMWLCNSLQRSWLWPEEGLFSSCPKIWTT